MGGIEVWAWKCREPSCSIIIGRHVSNPPEECPVCEGTMFVEVEKFLRP